MSNLTQLEQALLAEFESLAAAFEDLARQQSALSHRFLVEIARVSARQTDLEAYLQRVSQALETQNASTRALIESAQRLSGGWR